MKTWNKFTTWLLNDSSLDNRSLIDTEILYSAILLIAIGIIFVYSASIAYAVRDTSVHSQYYYLIRHLFYILVGLLAAVGMFNLPTSILKKYAFYISIVIVILLVGVLIPHIGRIVNGSRRWIGFGIVNIQPSELAKLGMAIYLSYYIHSQTELNIFTLCQI
jgi:cell division protein FtsW